MLVYAFGHRSRVGKDTAARFLLNMKRRQFQDKKVEQDSFARILKQYCFDLYKSAGLRDENYYNAHPEERRIKIPELGMTPVEIWVAVGMGMRKVNPDTWIRAMFAEHTGTDILIISDLRFQNEIDYIRSKHESKIIKIENPNAPIYSTEADEALDNYLGWDQTILNDGSLEQLYGKIQSL